METALLIILPIVTAAIAIASFFIARNAEARKRGNVDGSLRSDVTYIKEKVTELCRELKRIDATLTDHFERIIRLEESSKAAHKRLDEMTKK
ncbi:MAG: hypothetical protein FWD58_10120 [Firmicutes bacterium]|nr:hypothetical protein [Bacillota bacterium]